MNKVKETKKRKGFTLIELIAVIAILAILGAIIVPRILGYRTKAERSNIQSSAKTIVHAIQAYNADKDTNQIADTDTVDTAVVAVNGEGNTIATGSKEYTALKGITVGQLVGVSNGSFDLTVNGGVVTISNPVTGSIND